MTVEAKESTEERHCERCGHPIEGMKRCPNCGHSVCDDQSSCSGWKGSQYLTGSLQSLAKEKLKNLSPYFFLGK